MFPLRSLLTLIVLGLVLLRFGLTTIIIRFWPGNRVAGPSITAVFGQRARGAVRLGSGPTIGSIIAAGVAVTRSVAAFIGARTSFLLI